MPRSPHRLAAPLLPMHAPAPPPTHPPQAILGEAEGGHKSTVLCLLAVGQFVFSGCMDGKILVRGCCMDHKN